MCPFAGALRGGSTNRALLPEGAGTPPEGVPAPDLPDLHYALVREGAGTEGAGTSFQQASIVLTSGPIGALWLLTRQVV